MKLIGPFTQLLSMDGLPLKGSIRDEQMEIIPNAGVLIQNGLIERIGRFEHVYNEVRETDVAVEEITYPCVGTPGLIDCHTHICFGGSRAKDYSMRIAGKTYLEIAHSGGGIWDTVTQTRQASQAELETTLATRATRHLNDGVTTCEVKSGYGLDVANEQKMLLAIRNVATHLPIDLIPTCLAAHIKPRDFDGNAATYLRYITQELLPEVWRADLARRIDIFVEESAFSVDNAWPFLQHAQQMGFSITIHADQFSPGGSRLAAELSAVSADHLEASTETEIRMLAESDVIPVALPGASIGLGVNFTPARALLNAGASLAIASDWNPGSAPMGDLLMQAAVLGASEKLTTAETFAALTFRAGAGLELADRGVLSKGKLADIIAFPTSDYREILYHQGKMKPTTIWKRGNAITP